MTPYRSPQTSAERKVARSLPVLPIIGMIVGGIFLGGVAYCLVNIVDLHRRFPGLTDPSPNVDAHWPAVAEVGLYVFAGLAALVGIPTFVYSLVVFRRRRAESSP